MNENSKAYSAFCGIDVSKDYFDYCLLNQNKQVISHDKLPINLESLRNLIRVTAKDVNQNVIFLMESTGKYHRRISDYLAKAGFDVCIIQPLLIKNYTESKDLRKTKTDKKDAKMIAEYAFYNSNNLFLYDPGNSDLKDLSRFRLSLKKKLSALKTDFKARMVSIFPELVAVKDDFIFTKTIMSLLSECCLPSELSKKRVSTLDNMLAKCNAVRLSINGSKLKEMAKNSIGVNSSTAQFIITEIIEEMLQLTERIEKVEAELDAQSAEIYDDKIKIISSIVGIGKSTALSFLIETKDISLFDDWKKLSAYAGIDPGISQSGSSVDKKGSISKRGNKYLRSTLYLMADSVYKHNERYKAYYQKKRDEGKEFKETMIAISNKLVKLIYSLLNKGVLYDSNYENN